MSPSGCTRPIATVSSGSTTTSCRERRAGFLSVLAAWLLPPWRRLALCLLAGMALSAAFGTDANWDLQNYHLYGPFALLHHRLGIDYFAAGFQGYFNPLADLPYYLLRRVIFPDHPVAVAALAGLPYGAMAFLVVGIAMALLPAGQGRVPWAALFAAGIGLSGATIVSEIGTTFGDIVSGDAMLLAIFLVLRERGERWPALLGGFGLGAAVGLKFTTLIFAPGLAVWMVVASGRWRAAPRRLLWFGAGGAAGFLLLWGWWGWILWRRFHDPFYPLLSGVFPTPWAAPVDPHDPRFFPRDALQWIAYPFFWLQGRGFVATEGHLRDPRFALVYAALLAVAVRRAFPPHRAPPRAVLGLWLFFALSYLCWLLGFSILRYAVPLEALSGIVLATALRQLRPGWASARGLAVLLLGCLIATRPMGWGRIAYGRHLLEPPLPRLPARAVVFIAGAPLGFVAAALSGPGRRFIHPDFLPGSSPEVDVMRAALKAGSAAFVLTDFPDGPAGAAEVDRLLAPLGLRAARGCQTLHSPVQPHVRLCPVVGDAPAAKPG